MWFKLFAYNLLISILILRCGSLANGLHNNNKDDNVEEIKFQNDQLTKDIQPFLAPDSTNYRLPNDSLPISYNLEIRTDIHKGDFNFRGKVTILIQIINTTQEITLHARNMSIDNINLYDENSSPINFTLNYTLFPSHDFLVIDLPTEFVSGVKLYLSIEYNSVLSDQGSGFYRGSYVNAANETIWYATTQFEVIDARQTFPCYDEPGIRAPIDLSILHGKNFTAIANMEVQETFEAGEYNFTVFKQYPKMQTYLLAFLISDYDYINAVNTRVPQKIYATPAAIANGDADFAATVVGPVLKALEDLLGVQYPNEKMDHAALTVFNFGAMENFGLITYIARGLLLDRDLTGASKESQENSIIGLVAHEYAHQYFGDIVSPKWWTYVWLNEGFATLMASYIPSRINPEKNLMNNFVTGNLPRAFSSDVLATNSWAMNHYTDIPAELWSKFGAIGYQKSGCVLRMFMETMTEKTFAKGLNHYLTKMYMQAATPYDLHEGLQKAYDEDFPQNSLNIGDLMFTWENQPGYPLVSVQKYGNNLIFSQRRYPGSAGEIYSIPLTIATKSNANFNQKTPKKWLKNQFDSFTLSELNFASNDWVILNTQQVGYYRVDYDTQLWRALIKQLIENHEAIHSINRAVLQDEIYLSFTDSTLNRVTAGDCLDILSYFAKEDEPIAWTKAYTLFNMFNNQLLSTEMRSDFFKFVKYLTKPHILQYGYQGTNMESLGRVEFRNTLKSLNCLALDDDCIDHEYTNFINYYSLGISGSFDYCVAFRKINATIFDEILIAVTTNTNYPNRNNYLQNLGCSLIPESIKKLLEATLSNNNLTINQRRNIFNLYNKSPIALQEVIKFIDIHYKEMNDNLPANSLGNILLSMSTYINSVTSEAFNNILSAVLSDGFIDVQLSAQIKNIISTNNLWMNNNYPIIVQWFANWNQNTETTPVPPPITTQPPPPPITTQPPPTTPETTTPGSGNSIYVSFGIVIFYVLIQFLAHF